MHKITKYIFKCIKHLFFFPWMHFWKRTPPHQEITLRAANMAASISSFTDVADTDDDLITRVEKKQKGTRAQTGLQMFGHLSVRSSSSARRAAISVLITPEPFNSWSDEFQPKLLVSDPWE